MSKKFKKTKKEGLKPRDMQASIMPSREEIREWIDLFGKTMNGTKITVRRLSRLSGFSESVIKANLPSFGGKQTAKAKSRRVPLAETIIAAIEGYTTLKTQALKAGKKRVKKTQLHKKVVEILKGKGFSSSLPTVERHFQKFNYQTDVVDKARAGITREEAIELDLEQQPEWKNIAGDQQWLASNKNTNVLLRHIKYIYKIMSFRHGRFNKNMDGINKADVRAIAKKFHDSSKLGEKIEDYFDIKPKAVPIKSWTMNDVAWAINFIDWTELVGQYHYRIAYNRIVYSNPKLQVKTNPLEKLIHNDKDKYSTTTYFLEAGAVPKKYRNLHQESKKGEWKVIPDSKQFGKVLRHILNKSKLKGDVFKALTNKKGNVIKFTKAERINLEKRCLNIALLLGSTIGIRAGHQRKTGVGSVTFRDIQDWKNPITKESEWTISLLTKTSRKKGERKNFRLQAPIKKQIDALENILKKKGADTRSVHIIGFPMQKINKLLRNASEKTGLTKYIYKRGVYVTLGRGKKIFVPFKPGDPRLKNDKFLVKVTSLYGHPITEKDEDIDLHFHLLRAFHLDQLLRAGIPLEFAIQLGSGWSDAQTAIKHYATRMIKAQRTKYKAEENAILQKLIKLGAEA